MQPLLVPHFDKGDLGISRDVNSLSLFTFAHFGELESLKNDFPIFGKRIIQILEDRFETFQKWEMP